MELLYPLPLTAMWNLTKNKMNFIDNITIITTLSTSLNSNVKLNKE